MSIHEIIHIPNTPVYTGQGNAKVQSTVGGVNVSIGTTTLDKIIAASLSGLALWKNASYVPTTQQPNTQNPQMDAAYLALLAQQQNLSNTNNTSGIGNNLEKFITENSTILLVIGGALLLVQMKPLSRKNPMRIVQNGLKQIVK